MVHWARLLLATCTSAIARKPDAGATRRSVRAGGTFNDEGRWRRALATKALLRQRQQRVFVAGRRLWVFHREIRSLGFSDASSSRFGRRVLVYSEGAWRVIGEFGP
jgi:hypothetical protein